MSKELLRDCGCGNSYLAIRTDIYKDKREFIYCDCCGALATRSLWQSAHQPIAQPVERKPLTEPAQCGNCGGTFAPHAMDTGWIGRCECVEQPAQEPWPHEDSAYRPGGLAQVDPEPVTLDRGYTERLIDALEDNGDPVSIDAAEEFRRLITSPPQRKPLTEDEIEDMRGEANRGFNIDAEDYVKAVRDAEAAHDIGDKT